MTSQDVLNYYLYNPPFEITDKIKYAESLQFIADHSVMELSENDPILDETKFTTDPAIANEPYVLFNLQSLHQNFMELVALQEATDFATTVGGLCYQYGSGGVLSNTGAALNAALQSGSVIGYLATKDALSIIEEYYETKIAKIIYGGTNIKLIPNMEYYALFRRYRTIDEIPQNLILVFKKLFAINLYLAIYQSDIFSAEGGIRNVSLSGLSVSFNVPAADMKVRQLLDEKREVLSNVAMDYEDIGIF
jgi:hypothetical protein